MPIIRALLAIGVALALADASVVTLALPPMLDDLDTNVEGVAAVIGVYTLVLAALLPAASWLRRFVPDAALGAGGFGVFALAGALCALPDDLAPMLAFRALQAAGAAAGLVAGFALLRGGRTWAVAAVFGTAVGPALGGALTQAFDWRAIFLAQVPLALAAAAASWALRREDAEAARGGGAADGAAARGGGAAARGGGAAGGAARGGGAAGGGAAATGPAVAAHAGDGSRPSGTGRPAVAAPGRDARALVAPAGAVGALVALAALSAALTAVLFLLVLLLVSGWSLEPLTAAVAVSVLPVAAFAGARVRAPAAVRASAGCALVGAGVLALAVLPGAEPAWIVAPQVLAGVGMGMALPALAGGLLPERTPGQAAWLLSVRHAGITLALLAIAPIAAAQLDQAVADVRERGAALMLDARLPPLDKIQLAGPLVADLNSVNPRDALREALDAEAPRFADDPEQRREYAELTQRADETLVAGIEDAFRVAFVIAGALALAGAFAVLPRESRARRIALVATAAALVLPAAHAVVRPELAPERVAIADPCAPRDLPGTGGIDGFVQDAALTALDRAACRFGSSREELALALADEDEARAYRATHGVDPRSADGLLELLGISLG
jgi:MFS family permease